MRELFTDEPPLVTVLTSLAAGTDQLGAAVALKLGQQLDVVFPFREPSYPAHPEFTPPQSKMLHLLAAKARQTITLDGDYSSEQGRETAYTDARDLLLQNADLLVAVYAQNAPRRPGGTVDTVHRAIESGLPVVRIILNANQAQVSTRPILDCVRELLVLPELESHELKDALQRLAMMSGEATPPVVCTDSQLESLFKGTWDALHDLAGDCAPEELHQELPSSADINDDITLQPFAKFYDRASDLTLFFMRTYRGAFVLSYVLAGLAVAAAVSMLAVTIACSPDHPPLAAIVVLAAVKIAILVTLLLLQREGRKGRWQEAAADFRYLAELLRPMQWMHPVGTYPSAVELPLHTAPHDLRRTWMAWLVRALTRSAVCASANAPQKVTIDARAGSAALERAADEWIAGQIVYHAKAAARMQILLEGLERLASVLLWIVLGSAVVAAVMEIGHVKAAVIFGAIAAILPAFIAAIAGITFQSEAKRLAMRSRAMHEALRRQADVLRDKARDPKLDGTGRTARLLLKELSAMTIREASDWKVLYQVHEIHAG